MAGSRVFMNILMVESTGFPTTILPRAHTHTLDVPIMCFSYHVRSQFAPSPETRGLHESGEGDGGEKLNLTMHTIP